VHFETRDDISIDQVRELLQQAPGVELMHSEEGKHPTPVSHAAGKDPVFVGRLRRDLSHPRGISMWVVADNIRKGAALNAIQIMEYLEARRAAADLHVQSDLNPVQLGA
jgi:aspartate-semialdehyde dehydrogenase